MLSHHTNLAFCGWGSSKHCFCKITKHINRLKLAAFLGRWLSVRSGMLFDSSSPIRRVRCSHSSQDRNLTVQFINGSVDFRERFSITLFAQIRALHSYSFDLPVKLTSCVVWCVWLDQQEDNL
jgi:hypothetical protein